MFAIVSYYRTGSITKPFCNLVGRKTAILFINFRGFTSRGKRNNISYNRFKKLLFTRRRFIIITRVDLI